METFTHSTGDGTEHRFAHLTLYDIFGDPKKTEINGFVPVYRKRLKSEALENMRLAGLEKFEIAAELNGFDKHHRNRDPMEAFVEFIKEAPEAAQELVKHAYSTANNGAALPDTLASETAALCWRLLEPFGIGPSAEKTSDANKTSTYGDGGSDDPNPKAPLTYSTTVGGESTGPHSASA